MTTTPPEDPTGTWKRLLENILERLTPETFRQELPDLRARYGDDPEELGIAYLALLTQIGLGSLLSLAAALPLEEAEAALDTLAKAVGGFDFSSAAETLSDDDELTPYYRALATLAGEMIPRIVSALTAIFRAYVRGTYAGTDPNELIEQALALAETDPERGRELIAQAGALYLEGKPLWWRWPREVGGSPLAQWLSDVLFYGQTVQEGWPPMGPVDQWRAEFQAYFAEPPERRAAEEERLRAWKRLEAKYEQAEQEAEELAETLKQRLIEIGEGDLPREIYTLCEKNREAVIPILIELAADEELALMDAPGEGFVPIHAVHLLGHLKAAEAVPTLIDLVAECEPDEYLFNEALSALKEIGEPAAEPLFQFMRYSRLPEAKADLAPTLVEVAGEDERTFPTLARLLEELSWEEGKGLVIIALADLGDQRAVPLLWDQLESVEEAIDRQEVLAALEELGIPKGDERLLTLERRWVREEILSRWDRMIAEVTDPQELAEFIEGNEEIGESEAAHLAHAVADFYFLQLTWAVSMTLLSGDERTMTKVLSRAREASEVLDFEDDLSGYEPWLRRVYEHIASCAGRELQDRLHGLWLTLDHYWRGAYDEEADPNALILEARRLVGEDFAQAEALVGQAGALVLQGRPFWRRWPKEAPSPLNRWLYAIATLRRALDDSQAYPLEAWGERSLQAAPNLILRVSLPYYPDAKRVLDSLAREQESKVGSELIEALYEIPPLPAKPDTRLLRRFRRHRQEVIPLLIDLVEDRSTWSLEARGEGWTPALAIRLLGYLRASEAAETLVEVVAETEWDAALFESAILALLALERAAFPAVADYFRYGQDVETKVALAEVLVNAGQREPETYPWLATLWREAAWDQQRRLVAVAFGDLKDRRAVPLLRQALEDPQADDVDRDYVRWALQQLGEPAPPAPEQKGFLANLFRGQKVKTPLPARERLLFDEEQGIYQRARFTVWGEPLCPHCGRPMAWDEREGTWVHPPSTTPSAPAKPKRKKKKARKRAKKRKRRR